MKQGETRVIRVIPGQERRQHLQNYIRCAVRDSALSWGDVMSPRIVDRLLRVVSKDLKIIVADFGRKAGEGLLAAGASVLAGFGKK